MTNGISKNEAQECVLVLRRKQSRRTRPTEKKWVQDEALWPPPSQEVYGGQNLMGKKQGLPVICLPINAVLYFTWGLLHLAKPNKSLTQRQTCFIIRVLAKEYWTSCSSDQLSISSTSVIHGDLSHFCHLWGYFLFFPFFFFFFGCGPFLKVFTEFVPTLLLFHVLVFWPWDMWDPSSPTRNRTLALCSGRCSLSQWTAREGPEDVSIIYLSWVQLTFSMCINLF